METPTPNKRRMLRRLRNEFRRELGVETPTRAERTLIELTALTALRARGMRDQITRANPLATRGKPMRRAKDVRRLVIKKRREHSRKPDCIRERIERLVMGPYLELFARETKHGWDCWGD